MDRVELFKRMEHAQESMHAAERSLLMLEKKLMELAQNELADPFILEEIGVLTEELFS